VPKQLAQWSSVRAEVFVVRPQAARLELDVEAIVADVGYSATSSGYVEDVVTGHNSTSVHLEHL
jgi:hypothetical protein